MESNLLSFHTHVYRAMKLAKQVRLGQETFKKNDQQSKTEQKNMTSCHGDILKKKNMRKVEGEKNQALLLFGKGTVWDWKKKLPL